MLHHRNPTLMISSNSTDLPKGPPPNTATLKIRVSTYAFGGHRHSVSKRTCILNLGPTLGHFMVLLTSSLDGKYQSGTSLTFAGCVLHYSHLLHAARSVCV